MKLTDEQIRKIMEKEIKCKTLLVSFEDLEKTKQEYLDDGWEFVNAVPLSNRFKVTFRKVK